jgi:energy-coupling factor transporter ATP-binding protein EcfA2
VVVKFGREEFVAERWDHRPGEHVTILGPSGWGKTTLAFDLLAPLSTPEAPTIILVMKKRDKTVTKFGAEHKFRRVQAWPPPPNLKLWEPRKPAGYLLWPAFTGDPDVDEDVQYGTFRAAILDAMDRGKGIKVFGDEAADLKDIGLERVINHAYRQGRSLEQSTFTASQRPFGIPAMCYGGAMHLFIGNDTDKRSRDRYGEIGGVDKNLIIEHTQDLGQFEWLYLRRARGATKIRMCIVGA